MTAKRFTACVVLLVLNSCLLDATIQENLFDDIKRNTPNQISAAGYNVEVHHVVTSDGYVLEMHRIPFARGQNSSEEARPPVLMMHGLMAGSQSFLTRGPELSPGYNVADAGFDVWLGNARGNRHSRVHTTLDPDDDEEKFEFFDFSWEEIAKYDLPAMINYILEQTDRRKLHYVGHSQGGTVFLVLNSLLPEYNAKFASAHLLAGVGYQKYFPNGILTTVADNVDHIYALALRLGIVEIFPPLPDWIPIDLRSDVQDCTRRGHPELCSHMAISELTKEGNSGGGGIGFGASSIKQIAHYGQNIRDKSFCSWDYGFIGNLGHYGTSKPPQYDLSLITVNLTMHYSVSDELLDERDVLAMAEVIPNAKARRVARDSFTHTDFLAASDARELLTNYIIETMIRDENALNDSGDNGSEPEIDEPGNSNSAKQLLGLSVFQIYIFVVGLLYIGI